MDLLPEANEEMEHKRSKIKQMLMVNRKLRNGLIIAVAIIFLGLVAIISTYSNISASIEQKLREEYDEQIVDLQTELEDAKDQHEEELEKQKKSYEKKLDDAEQKHAKEIEKKDSIIAEKQEEIEKMVVELKVNFDEIETEIQTVGKLTTIDYHYTYAGTHKDVDKFFGFELPWTKNSFIAQWDGVVALGVDLSKVTITADEVSKAITVSMPDAEIFYHDVDEKSFAVLDEKNNLLNPITVADIKQFDIIYEQKIKDKIAEQRMLEDAYGYAQTMIESILKSVPQVAEQYTINFKKLA